MMTLQEYEALPTKTQPGYVADPTAIYYEPRIDGSNNTTGQLYIDAAGAQDVTKHLHLVYLRQAMDFVNPNDATDFPQEQFLRLSWETSLQICGMFDADWTEDRKTAYLIATARAAEGSTPETEYFQVEEDSY
jgi:hypothetical protein